MINVLSSAVVIKTIGISDSLLDAEDSIKNLQNHLDKLAVLTYKLFPEIITAKDVVSIDDFVNTAKPIMNDKEVITGVLDDENLETEEGQDGD